MNNIKACWKLLVAWRFTASDNLQLICKSFFTEEVSAIAVKLTREAALF